MLVGVIHLPALPGSPGAKLPLETIVASVIDDARALADAGFDVCMIENFGDAPFFKDAVPPVTVSAMTVCALAAIEAVPALPIAVNVLRNDAASALAIAHVVGAAAIRINIHCGARMTDQGIIEGRAAETLRLRSALRAANVAIWADVDVKHSAALAPYPLDQEVHDVVERGLATAVIVTGDGTGKAVDAGKLATVRAVAGHAKVLVGSGATLENLPMLAKSAHGVIVGSALRDGGRAGGAIVAARAKEFAAAYRSSFGS
jgi:hypothetical protein